MICNNLKKCIEGQLTSFPVKNCNNRNMNKCIESSDNRSAVKCEENRKKYVYICSKIIYRIFDVIYRIFYIFIANT